MPKVAPHRFLLYFLLAILSAVVFSDLAIAFSRTTFSLAHDEAEHLHVVFALQRGERPYLDFIENHPVFLHSILSTVVGRLGDISTIRLYLLVKAFLAVHCIGTLLLFFLGTRDILGKNQPLLAATAYLAALAYLGIWDGTSDVGNQKIWELRPDWVSYFYATLCLYLHHKTLDREFNKRQKSHMVLLMAGAGVCAGLSVGILAKSIYLFAPYAITLLTLPMALSWHEAHSAFLKHWRPLLIGHAILIVAAALTISACLAIELTIANIDLSTYYKANFAFNASKHIPFNSLDFNPANVLTGFTGLGLAGTVLLGLFLYGALLNSHNQRHIHHYAILFFCGCCLILNAIIPAFSNGLTWAHYFIPSLLALTTLFAYVLIRLCEAITNFLSRQNFPATAPIPKNAWIWTKRIALFLMLLQVTILLAQRIHATYLRYAEIRYTQELYRVTTGDFTMEFVPDHYLPTDLHYLTFNPTNKPVRAPIWGYYFMLFPDSHVFPDMHRLGLAPDIEAYWRVLFRIAPPDAILITDQADFAIRATVMRLMRNGDISWMWPSIASRYACRNRGPVSLFVRKDLLDRFPPPQWSRCPDQTTNKDLTE